MLSLYTTALVCFMTAWALPAIAETQQQPAGQYKHIVDADFVAQYATTPKKDDVLIIDSRPARKYDKGHIVPAINISNSQFDKLTHLLPEDKSTLLIFYCGGLKCNLSHKSAAKAEALGYTNIKVYAAGYPDWKKAGHITGVSAAYVKKLVDKPTDAVIVDARPTRKFKKGHVPGAINISNREFDEKLDMLPSDKTTELIYYCGGYKCALSSKSAAKAIAKGYTNVKLFQAGYPAWKAAYGAAVPPVKAAAATSDAPAVETGEEAGIITIASFNKLMKGHVDKFYWYDVRDPEEVEADGTYAKAVVMSVDDLEERVIELPSDKPIIFFCSTGARSGEAYDIVKMKREALEVFFLDANVQFHKDGSMPTASPPD
ncbi:MAG: rhodanese-like domain-containing protein [Halobacteria archaeon]|nr:rhodanese-like domain-containing protein [Halobacteria archaeon]